MTRELNEHAGPPLVQVHEDLDTRNAVDFDVCRDVAVEVAELAAERVDGEHGTSGRGAPPCTSRAGGAR